MKKLSIKGKVTVWYMSFLVVIVAVMMFFVVSASDRVLRNSSRIKLKNTVEKSLSEIEYDEEGLEIDDDLEFFQNGIYLSFYDQNGQLIFGRTPSGFPEGTVFAPEEVQIVESDEGQWYSYDILTRVPSYGDLWVRGIASQSETGNTTRTMLMLTLIGLPFIVLIAAVGGYYITKKAFAPVLQITKAAEAISGGDDLSRRIDLGKGKDEIYTLANTFDGMFERLEYSFEKEKQFTSDASHELRTPTAVIRAQCEYALNNADTLEEAREALEKILQQSKKMSGLISQLLTIARMDKGNQKLELEFINISELAEMVIEEQQLIASERKIEIQMEVEKDICMYADQTLVMRMLMNLLSNAVIYGRENGKVLFRMKKEGGFVCGAVEDDGIGIAEEHLGKVWDRFFQADNSRTIRKNEGAGLGLAMVKWIAEAHGGSVAVKSILGKGSTFEFHLPVNKKLSF